MPVPALIAGGAALAGGAMSYFSAKEQNRMQREMAREQMAFQERMSSTAYQRAVKDMRAAGLNPMLAFERGGASSPGGAQPQIVPELGAVASSAMAVKEFSERIANMREQRRNLQMDTTLKLHQSQVANSQRHHVDQQMLGQQILNVLGELDIATAKNIADVSRTPFGKMMEYMRRIPGVGAFLPAITRGARR